MMDSNAAPPLRALPLNRRIHCRARMCSCPKNRHYRPTTFRDFVGQPWYKSPPRPLDLPPRRRMPKPCPKIGKLWAAARFVLRHLRHPTPLPHPPYPCSPHYPPTFPPCTRAPPPPPP